MRTLRTTGDGMGWGGGGGGRMVRLGLERVSARAAHGPNAPERRSESRRERANRRDIPPRIRGNEREITVSL